MIEVTFVIEFVDGAEIRRWGEADVDAHLDELRLFRSLDGYLRIADPDDPAEVELEIRDELAALVHQLAFAAPVALLGRGEPSFMFRTMSWQSHVVIEDRDGKVRLSGSHIPSVEFPSEPYWRSMFGMGERYLAFLTKLYGETHGRVRHMASVAAPARSVMQQHGWA